MALIAAIPPHSFCRSFHVEIILPPNTFLQLDLQNPKNLGTRAFSIPLEYEASSQVSPPKSGVLLSPHPPAPPESIYRFPPPPKAPPDHSETHSTRSAKDNHVSKLA